MNRHFHYNSAERTGRRLGQVWRSLIRLQNLSRRGLVRIGLAPGAANLVIALGWLLVIAAILRYGLVAAIISVVAIVLASLGGLPRMPNSVDREYEWTRGFLGFGLYDADGFRVDPHNPEKRN